jgi:hypothetical protein
MDGRVLHNKVDDHILFSSIHQYQRCWVYHQFLHFHVIQFVVSILASQKVR